MKKIVIIGAGPTGLGAGYRLKELGHNNFKIFEKNSYIGGLSASFTQDNYTFDIGGHVVFSHYEYFDKIFNQLLGEDFQACQRSAHIYLQNRFIPYPFQNNIQFLEKEQILECLEGLLEIEGEVGISQRKAAQNFQEWVYAAFGQGIAKYFMNPYNFKVWAHPLEMLSKNWIAERVSVIDLKTILSNVIMQKEDSAWGPNNMFKYPLFGGTGGLFSKFQQFFQDKLILNSEIKKIDYEKKIVYFEDESESYDILINTMPLDIFISQITPVKENLQTATKDLLHNGVFVVGIGLNKKIITEKSWVYFPETVAPFYRLTYLSNYSSNMSPNPSESTNLLLEISYSKYKKEDKLKIIEDAIQGLINTKIIDESDIEKINCKFLFDAEYAYPIPSLLRDEALVKIIPFLESNEIYSRGRFGLWRYETGNMDHSLMQGVEVVDLILNQQKEVTRYLS
ncbi:MAG: NAD(P)-binding protein [Candidatus Margulisiibacteriota bacterium]|jgi:protoporphyrinogen oxidase